MASTATSSHRARVLYARTAYPKRYNAIKRQHRRLTTNLHRVKTPIEKGSSAGLKAEAMTTLRHSGHPLGDINLRRNLLVEPKPGGASKYRRRITSGSITRFKKRLGIRRKRMDNVKHWSGHRRIKPT